MVTVNTSPCRRPHLFRTAAATSTQTFTTDIEWTSLCSALSREIEPGLRQVWGGLVELLEDPGNADSTVG